MKQEMKDKIIEGVLRNPHYLENSSDVLLLIGIVINLTEQQIVSHTNQVIDEFIKNGGRDINAQLKELKQKIQIS